MGASLFYPMPAEAELVRTFEAEVWAGVIGQNPAAFTTRVGRARGGNIRALPYGLDDAIDQAAWDLTAQELGLPLYQLLGGRQNRVRAYASGLDYHLSDDELTWLFGRAAELGFRGFKVKVGHPDVEWDIHRLRLVRQAVGAEGPLMADANEAWSPGVAIQRLHAYHRAGIDLLWIEDPCLRNDFAGLREVAAAVPFTLLNTGEYLGLSDKRRLIEARAVDILNIHGNFTAGLRAAWLANDYGLQVSLGNTFLEIGVHLAAALPGDPWLEYSFQNYNVLAEAPVQFAGGFALAPERPGHGIRLSAAARKQYHQPEITDTSGLTPPLSMLTQPN
jgi:L-alanine-DL-glutamate epimerase-like enolase superfamily enzyme